MADVQHLGLYIVSNALRSGAKAGVVAALGITAGCFVHIFAAALGVSALLAAWATRRLGAMFVGFGIKLALTDAPQP